MNRPARLHALLSGLLLASPLSAQQVVPLDTSRWACSFCVWPLGWRGNFDIGPGWVSDEALKFADNRGLDEAGAWLSMHGQARYLDEAGRFLDLWWTEPALDARRIALRGGQQGAHTVQLGWTEIPHYTGQGARSPFLGVGSGELSLPAGWQSADTTAGLGSLDSALRPVALGLQRRNLDLGVRGRTASPWRWRVDAQRSEREGTRAFGAGQFTFNTSHLPAPVDHRTDRVELGVDYLGERGHFNAGLGGSWFDNGQQSLGWDNPFTPIAGAEHLRAALEPANRAWTLRMAGAWRARPELRLSGQAGIGEARQDETFLPYSSNPEFEEQPLPRPSLAGKVEALSLNAAGQVDWRLARGIDLTARWRFEDRDNRTPVTEWFPVITDVYQRDATLNRPYSFQREQLGLQGRYRAGTGWRLGVGLDRKSIERSLQSVHRSSEDTAWVEAALGRWAALDLRLRLEAADRDTSPYQPFVDPGLPGNPLMRKFNLAERERKQAVLDADWSLAQGWSLNASARWSDEDYRRSPLGLQSSSTRGLNFGINQARHQGLAWLAWVGFEQIEALIAGQENFMLDWRALSEDEFITWGLGATLPLGRHWQARLDGFEARSQGEIDTAGDPFPALDTRLRNLALRLHYDNGRPWAWQLVLEHERYDSEDWQQDGLAPDSIAAVLTMGVDSPDYSVSVVRVMGSYRFQ